MDKLLSDYIVEIRNLFDNYKHRQFVKLLKNDAFDFKEALLANQKSNKKIRDTLHCSLGSINEPSMKNVHWANTFHFTLKKAVEKYCKVTNSDDDIVSNIIDIQILKYPIGGFYVPHVDSGEYINRMLSFLYFANEDYVGGELYFRLNDKDYPVKIEENKLIIFPSNFMYRHGVKPVTQGTKYSVVAWAL